VIKKVALPRRQRLMSIILARDRDQEDQGSKPAQANSSMRHYLKKIYHKKRLMEWLKVKALSSNPSTKGKKTKNNNNEKTTWPPLQYNTISIFKCIF
jgi:hypothetical protein